MWTQTCLELDQETLIEGNAALGIDIDPGHPAADAVRIELRVPRRIERVRDVDAASVTADLDHLRAAVERAVARLRVRCAAHHPADLERAGELGLERIAHVVL